MSRRRGMHVARHPAEGRFVVLVAPPRRGGRGLSVSSPTGVGPAGELRRLQAAGWVFERIR